MCKFCDIRRVSRDDCTERRYDYDGTGHVAHVRWDDGTERWYDADGNITKWKDKQLHRRS